METLSAPVSPTRVVKPNASTLISASPNQSVCENTNSVFSTNAVPATFKNTDSIPRAPAVLTLPHPAERAHGLINNSVAPAEPARCSLPAFALIGITSNAPAKKDNAICRYLFIIVGFKIRRLGFIRTCQGQRDALHRTI